MTVNEKQTKPEYERVVVRHYPKTIFFYPLGIVSLLLGILLPIVSVANSDVKNLFAALWLVMFAFNFLIVSFEFSLGKTAGIVISIAFLYVTAILLQDWLEGIPEIPVPVASADAAFYIYSGLIILLTLGLSLFLSFFNYWEIRPTEIYLHGGFFEDSQRFGNAQHAHIYKETPDIFERILFRSGTIVIIPDGSKEVYRLENVYNASAKEKMIREILSYVPDKPAD